MKLSDINQNGQAIQYLNQANQSNQLDKTKIPQEVKNQQSSEDKVDISIESKDMQKINDVLKVTPEMRSERIADLKNLVDNNQYQIKSEAVADKMIREFLLEMNK